MTRHTSPQKQESTKAAIAPASNPLAPRPFAQPADAVEVTPEPQTVDSPPVEFSVFSADGGPPSVQPKLTTGTKDPYEQEADRVAKQVVQRIHAPRADPPPIQRVANHANAVTGAASPDLETSIHRARGLGQPLAPKLQQQMGQAMGADFSGVRVHTDGRSDQLNRSIRAKAFTTGHDVFFRHGEYNPECQRGMELIAHELTHVVQQSGGGKAKAPDKRNIAIAGDAERIERKCSEGNGVVQAKVDIRYSNLQVNDDAIVEKISSDRLTMPDPREQQEEEDSSLIKAGHDLMEEEPAPYDKGTLSHNRHSIPDHLITARVIKPYEGQKVQTVKTVISFKGNAAAFDSVFRAHLEKELGKMNAIVQGHLVPKMFWFGGGRKLQGCNQWHGDGAANMQRNTEKNKLTKAGQVEAAFAIDFDPNPGWMSEEFESAAKLYAAMFQDLVPYGHPGRPDGGKWQWQDVLLYAGNLAVFKEIKAREAEAEERSRKRRSGTAGGFGVPMTLG